MLNMSLQHMKDMYGWILLMTKNRLPPTSHPTYIISRLNSTHHSSLTEARSDIIG